MVHRSAPLKGDGVSGMALPAVVLALALLGSAVTVGFWAALVSLRSARSFTRSVAASGLVQAIAAEAVAAWDGTKPTIVTIHRGSWRVTTGAQPVGLGLVRFRVSATSVDGAIAARIVVFARPPDLLRPEAAVTAPHVTLGPQATLRQAGPACGWSTPTPQTPPPGDPDPWGEQARRWVGRASTTVNVSRLRPDPISWDGRCVTGASGNWGDPRPARPCSTFQPIVHVPGDLTILGGSGHGVLVVDGDLVLRGGFRFVGLVLVRGRVETGGAAGQIEGALVAGGEVVLAGPAVIEYSPCVLDPLFFGLSGLVPISTRAWSFGF